MSIEKYLQRDKSRSTAREERLSLMSAGFELVLNAIKGYPSLSEDETIVAYMVGVSDDWRDGGGAEDELVDSLVPLVSSYLSEDEAGTLCRQLARSFVEAGLVAAPAKPASLRLLPVAPKVIMC